MNPLSATLLGVIEGLTEYLPISSTFHLIWSAKYLGIPQTDFQKLFEVVIQSGAILAVAVLYLGEVINNPKIILKVGASFIPTAIVGFLFYKIIKGVFFENLALQLGVFIAVGAIFIIFEKLKAKGSLTRKIENISYLDAVIVGLAQSMAVVPGVSRAGAVILALAAMGVNRKEAAKYSFLLAVPTLCAASGYDLLKSYSTLFASPQNLPLLLFGFVSSFICAVIVVKWFVGYMQRHSLALFGWYRIILGAILLLVPFINL